MDYYGSRNTYPKFRRHVPHTLLPPVYGVTDFDALYRKSNKHPGLRFDFFINCLEADADKIRSKHRGSIQVDLAFDICGRVLRNHVAIFLPK
jgi:hypothetical protein